MAPDLDSITPASCMEGYLKKPKKWSKRYFVVREGPPPCLEYYDSHRRKGSGKPKRVIKLSDAWYIGKKVSGKQKHLIGIYTEREHFCMAAENETSQTNWVNSLRQAVIYHRGTTSSSSSMYNHIWQGNVDAKDLQECDPHKKINLQGLHRCCLTDRKMVFIPVDAFGGCNIEAQNYVEVTIASIRSCGHKENVFFMEPGRSSGIGGGQLRFELDDHAIADSMHMTILDAWKTSKPDDSRPRSYTGSGNTRSSNNHRSRQNYCPPPSQVGLGKQSVSNGSKKDSEIRPRCGSLNNSVSRILTEDQRLRASSEGEKNMTRFVRYPSAGEVEMRRLRNIRSNQQNGSISPHPHFRQRSLQSLSSAIHSRTPSLPGSTAGSTCSSTEYLPIHSDDNAGVIDRRYFPDTYIDSTIPPPPEDVPSIPPINSQWPSHSRSHSSDGSSETSSSTSPCTDQDMSTGTSPSQDVRHPHPPSQQPKEPCSMDYAPMSSPMNSPEASEYMLMSPGVLQAATCIEDSNGYVPMCSLTHSQPRDIANRRHPFLDEKMLPGSHSPVSPSRSPEKYPHNRRNMISSAEVVYPHNVRKISGRSPCSLTQKFSILGDVALPPNRAQSKLSPNDPMIYSNDYAFMADFPSYSSSDHEYVPMKNVVVGNVIAVAQSTIPYPDNGSQRYPHEVRDRATPRRRRNTVSSALSSSSYLIPHPRMSKHGRRGSTRRDSKSSDSPPPSPGGEYVSIDYERARKQIGNGSANVKFEPYADSESPHSVDSKHMSKIAHDSNRNILPNVEITTKDENTK